MNDTKIAQSDILFSKKLTASAPNAETRVVALTKERLALPLEDSRCGLNFTRGNNDSRLEIFN